MKNHCKSNLIVKDKHKRAECGARIRRLSEAIILQAIEDLWIKKERGRCIKFFTGEEFKICAGIAGMNLHDKVKVLNLCWNILRQNSDREVRRSDTLQAQAIPDAASLTPILCFEKIGGEIENLVHTIRRYYRVSSRCYINSR